MIIIVQLVRPMKRASIGCAAMMWNAYTAAVPLLRSMSVVAYYDWQKCLAAIAYTCVCVVCLRRFFLLVRA